MQKNTAHTRLLQPSIETHRLIIRAYQPSDVFDAAKFLCDAKTMHYIPEEFANEQDVEVFMMDSENQDQFFPLVLQETGKVIGHLFFAPLWGMHSYEIGWILHQHYQQQGYAKEAAHALLAYGFEQGIHQVMATCHPENIASWHLMQALGMRRDVCFQYSLPDNNTEQDAYCYTILKDEWLAQKKN